MAKRKRATKAEKNSKKPKSTKEEAVQDKPQENNIKNATGATTKDKTTATKCSTAYKPGMIPSSQICLIRANASVKKSHPGIHGCRCKVIVKPVTGSTNTWFTVMLINPPNNKNVDKYLKATGIKLQASHLVPIDSSQRPIPIDTLTTLTSSTTEASASTSAASSAAASKSSSSGGGVTGGNARGPSKANVLLSTTGPITHWIGRRVHMTVGKQRGLDAYVTGSGNGWVQLQYMDGDKNGDFIDQEVVPSECAKRSYELKCAVAGVSSTDDKCHDGGEIKGKSILITGGFHKKKKGLITGGGHGLYLIELSGREKGSVLKRITQFKRVDGVSISTKQPDSSPQSSRSSSRASGARNAKKTTTTTSSSDDTSSSSESAAAAAPVVSVARSRPRRANAGVNKKKEYSVPRPRSSKRDEDMSDSDEEEKPTTPAAKAAYRNKEKVKTKLRTLQENSLKRSKRSTRTKQYNRNEVQSTSSSSSSSNGIRQLSDRDKEREEWRAIYEMQVEQYQERVQKYVERSIEKEKLEPRPDITGALIKIEKAWNHDDGCKIEEAKSTYEWETNDPEVYDLCPDTREFSAMTSFRHNVDIASQDQDTRDAIRKYEAQAPVYWLGNGIQQNTNPNNSTRSNTASSSSSSSNLQKGQLHAWNRNEDWQPSLNDAGDSDMCAYDWLRSRMNGGVEWFYPKGTTTNASNQFVMENQGVVKLEPSPVYGNHIAGELHKFGRNR